MSETLICPYCERIVDVDAMENCTLWNERADLASRLGKVWRLANEYADCFRAKPGVRMSLKKRVRILTEIAGFWEKGSFEYEGKRYKVLQDEIMLGMKICCDRDLVGFQNHNYLKVILAPKSQRLSAEGMTATEEEKREQQRRETRMDGSLNKNATLFDKQSTRDVDATLEEKINPRGEQKRYDPLLTADEIRKRAGSFLKGMG